MSEGHIKKFCNFHHCKLTTTGAVRDIRRRISSTISDDVYHKKSHRGSSSAQMTIIYAIFVFGNTFAMVKIIFVVCPVRISIDDSFPRRSLISDLQRVFGELLRENMQSIFSQATDIIKPTILLWSALALKIETYFKWDLYYRTKYTFDSCQFFSEIKFADLHRVTMIYAKKKTLQYTCFDFYQGFNHLEVPDGVWNRVNSPVIPCTWTGEGSYFVPK